MKKRLSIIAVVLIGILCMNGCNNGQMTSEEASESVKETQETNSIEEFTAKETNIVELETSKQEVSTDLAEEEDTDSYNATDKNVVEEETELSFEEKISNIRKVYNDIQNNLSSYEQYTGNEAGIECYASDEKLFKVVVSPGAYDLENADVNSYSAEYYYENNFPVFVFVFNGTEEYRYYLDCTNGIKCIRYIDSTGMIYDYEEGKSEDISSTFYFCYLAYMEAHWMGYL